MDGWSKKKYGQQWPHIDRYKGQRIVAEQNFLGGKDAYCIVERKNFL